jgi:cytochrome c peroxidase
MVPLRVGIVFIIALLFAAPFLLSLAEKDGESATCAAGREYVLSHIDSICSYMDSSAQILKNSKEIPQKQLIEYYHLARKSYKRISYFIDYYSPTIAKYYINGALVPKFDNEYGNQIIPPHGFQVIEQQLFTKGIPPIHNCCWQSMNYCKNS